MTEFIKGERMKKENTYCDFEKTGVKEKTGCDCVRNLKSPT
jgi:hypothetical protein